MVQTVAEEAEGTPEDIAAEAKTAHRWRNWRPLAAPMLPTDTRTLALTFDGLPFTVSATRMFRVIRLAKFPGRGVGDRQGLAVAGDKEFQLFIHYR